MPWQAAAEPASTSTSPVRDFRYPLEAEARKVLQGFKAPEIRVSHDALVLVLDFELRVK